MSRFPAFLLVVQIRNDRVAGKGLERERGDELLCVGSHHHMDITVLFGQQAREVRSPVRGDGTGDAKDDIAFFRFGALDFLLRAHSSGGTALAERILSASIIDCIRRRSSPMVLLMSR